MNLRKATILFALGCAYTILHKLVFALVPTVGNSVPGRTVASFLWIAAAFTLILFAYEYLRELSPGSKLMRYSLLLIIVFTSIVIFSKLPLGLLTEGGIEHRLMFGIASLLNSFAILLFALSFSRLTTRGSPLWYPIHTLIWACGLTAILAIVSFGYFAAFLVTGREYKSLPFLQPLSMLSFFCTYGTTIWFLIRFSKFINYREFAHR